MGVFTERRTGVLACFKHKPAEARRLISGTQIALYVMVGGGKDGEEHARNPLGATRDTRAGCAPYSVKDVETIRGALVGLAEAGGLDPSNLPTRLEFHKAGVL